MSERSCPTCGASLVDAMPRPATSRVDNETIICARCSDLEAMLDVFKWRTAVRLHWGMGAATDTLRELIRELPHE